MLEVQKDKIHQRSRLRAKGASEEEITKTQHLPFKPAYQDGRRKGRETASPGEVPTGQFAFRRRS